jgi:hypothetical protein
VDNLPRTGQAAQIPMNDHPIETVVYKTSRLPNSFVNVSIGRPPFALVFDNKIVGQTTGGFKIPNMFG